MALLGRSYDATGYSFASIGIVLIVTGFFVDDDGGAIGIEEGIVLSRLNGHAGSEEVSAG